MHKFLGFGLLEAGTVSIKNEGTLACRFLSFNVSMILANIMVKNAVDVIFGGLSFWAVGMCVSPGCLTENSSTLLMNLTVFRIRLSFWDGRRNERVLRLWTLFRRRNHCNVWLRFLHVHLSTQFRYHFNHNRFGSRSGEDASDILYSVFLSQYDRLCVSGSLVVGQVWLFERDRCSGYCRSCRSTSGGWSERIRSCRLRQTSFGPF